MVVGLEFFRPGHGHEEIDEQKQGDEAHEDGFHGGGRFRVARRSARTAR